MNVSVAAASRPDFGKLGGKPAAPAIQGAIQSFRFLEASAPSGGEQP
jgi:hypothetical protein